MPARHGLLPRGKVLPLSFKFQDDSGELQTVANVRVRSAEQKNYSGIPSREFSCQAVIGGLFKRILFDFLSGNVSVAHDDLTEKGRIVMRLFRLLHWEQKHGPVSIKNVLIQTKIEG